MFSQTAAAITVLSGLFTFVIGQQPEYAQCGGIGYTGSTVCASPYVCTYENDYYYQCLPGTGGTTTTTKTTSVSTKTTTTTSKTTTTASHTTTASSAQCTVNSVSSASSLSSCSSVVIEGFTVPAGSTVTIAAASGASITMAGNVVFAQTTTSGPLFTLNTNNVNFNGNGYHFDGQGALYWDGEGTGGGVTKPHPLIKLKGYGTFADFTVLNSPAHAISVGTSSTTTIQSVTVDDSAGASKGANTDGFDIGASDLTLLNNVVKNQDDCVAINSGSNILIQGMSCDGGHGLSIGSIDSGDTVSNVRFISNTITNSQNGLRIKVDASADSTAKVSGVTYTSNKVSGISKYGVLITQSYPDSYSTPGTSSTISGISFTGGTTTVAVTSAAYGLAIDCGHCTGTWDLSGLDVTAVGKGHELTLGGGVTLSGGTY